MNRKTDERRVSGVSVKENRLPSPFFTIHDLTFTIFGVRMSEQGRHI
ncbi:MAG TPA: hypothetical protein VF708_14550 [Pyrinomonadaceae bacterium]